MRYLLVTDRRVDGRMEGGRMDIPFCRGAIDASKIIEFLIEFAESIKHQQADQETDRGIDGQSYPHIDIKIGIWICDRRIWLKSFLQAECPC